MARKHAPALQWAERGVEAIPDRNRFPAARVFWPTCTIARGATMTLSSTDRFNIHQIPSLRQRPRVECGNNP